MDDTDELSRPASVAVALAGGASRSARRNCCGCLTVGSAQLLVVFLVMHVRAWKEPVVRRQEGMLRKPARVVVAAGVGAKDWHACRNEGIAAGEPASPGY